MSDQDEQACPRVVQDPSAVRVVLADMRVEVRSALRLLLEQDGGMTVTSEAVSAGDLLEQVGVSCPDVVLVDCDLPGLRPTGLLLRLRAECPQARVVALCIRPEMRLVALTAGADAFLCKTEPPETLVDIIHEWFGLGQRIHGTGDEQRRERG